MLHELRISPGTRLWSGSMMSVASLMKTTLTYGMSTIRMKVDFQLERSMQRVLSSINSSAQNIELNLVAKSEFRLSNIFVLTKPPFLLLSFFVVKIEQVHRFQPIFQRIGDFFVIHRVGQAIFMDSSYMHENLAFSTPVKNFCRPVYQIFGSCVDSQFHCWGQV